MSVAQITAARTIWRARRGSAGGDTWAGRYTAVLAALIVLVPVVRVLWSAASSPSGLAVLASAHGTSAVTALAAALWIGGVLLGRKRGPALLPQVLLHAVADSGIRRSHSLRRPVLHAAAVVAIGCLTGAALVGGVLFAHDLVSFGGVLQFAVAAAATGIVTTVMWLTGQVFPRAAMPLAFAMLVLAALSAAVPHLLVSTPWGWIGAAYPTEGPNAFSAMAAMVLAAAAVIATPVLLDRLTGAQLAAQAARWERVAAFTVSFDFRAAAEVYEVGPRFGRSLRAIVPGRRRWVTFWIRDAVGQLRRPGRSLGAIAATIAGGVLMTLASVSSGPAAIVASAAAGLVLYAATGPFTTGLRHAASVAGDYPMYGISDRCLVLLHAVFPLTVLFVVLSATAAGTVLAGAAPLGDALTGACGAGILVLALRIGSSLQGPLPPSLLTPIATPVGDLSIIMRLGWACGDPLIAMLGTVMIAALPAAGIPFLLLAAGTLALIGVRWWRRR